MASVRDCCHWAWAFPASALGWPVKRSKILFLGQDNAGKTTLLHLLEHDRLELMASSLWACALTTPIPSCKYPHGIYLASGDISFEGTKFTIYDIPDHHRCRYLLKDYIAEADGIVYLVDSSDPDRFPEVKAKLSSLFSWKDLPDIPIAILGNKTDANGAVGENELRRELGLNGKTTGRENWGPNWKMIGIRPLEVFMCSVVLREGYQEGLRWLTENI